MNEGDETLQHLLKLFGIDSLHHHCHIKGFLKYIANNGIFSRNEVIRRGIKQIDISNKSVQLKRNPAPFDPELAPYYHTWHNYVPLYFSTLTPTLYVQTVQSRERPEVCSKEEIVFFDIDPVPVFQTPGVKFTDGNAAAKSTKDYNDIADLKKLNWDYIRRSGEFSITGYLVRDPEFQRAKCSEVLVPDHVPIEYVKRVVVASNRAKENIVGYCERSGLKCEVEPAYYFRQK